MELKVVAEGIETEQQCLMLHEYGCDFMQGYYFSKALPADEIITLVQAWQDVNSGKCRMK
jgi:EAL domain-containing protein (putative c-di-GMP-specific phosphodiesterase class I)